MSSSHTKPRRLRSRSPTITRNSFAALRKSPQPSNVSPSMSLLSRIKSPNPGDMRHVLPSMLQFNLRLWPSQRVWSVTADSRRFGEGCLLVASAVYATYRLNYGVQTDSDHILWISIELLSLTISTFVYIVWSISSMTTLADLYPTPPSASNHTPEPRETRRSMVPPLRKDGFAFIWMSVPKNYRESGDDGISTGLLLGPLIACAFLYASLSEDALLPAGWRIEPPAELRHASAKTALIASRYSLVDLACFCSTMLLYHVAVSWWYEARYRAKKMASGASLPEGERSSVPRSEGLRSWYYVLFTLSVAAGAIAMKLGFRVFGIGIWQHLSLLEITIASTFFQFALYVAIRMAHRGFTLGELGLVCFGGTSLAMELVNITTAKLWPLTTPFIKTYRLPTPLLVFQIALVAGTFLVGFLLSPFLLLSRHIAQRPARRLKRPEEKTQQRRYMALGFYVGSVLIVGGLIGFWTRFCLGLGDNEKRDPWIWVIKYIPEGRRQWSRPALLAYWILLGILSVAGWNRQLARSRRYRVRANATDNLVVPAADGPPSPGTTLRSGTGLSTGEASVQGAPALGISFVNSANMSSAATEFLDAANKHVPTLGLNGRRKFFHALAVIMFIPGIAFDPAFTHLSFSVAFSLFTFAEYVRYFAIYPFGATVHLFMNEFIDHKDSGTAILSHFYLLTGCASSLWLEGPSLLLQFTGVLILGLGDALASIVGKRLGRYRWARTTSKTLEGSLAYILSIVLSAWLLRLCGLSEPFSTIKYTTIISVSAVLEALSVQNDNLTVPLYAWSMLALAAV